MRRSVVLGLLVCLALLVVGGVSFAALKGDKDGIVKKQVLSFVDVTAEEAFFDAEPASTGEDDVSPGDTFFFHDELWNLARTKQRGTLDGSCKFLIGFIVHCEATVFLPKGTIELAGGLDFGEEEGPSTQFIAVVGGTRRYENVVGQAKLIEEEGSEDSRLVLELIPSFKRP